MSEDFENLADFIEAKTGYRPSPPTLSKVDRLEKELKAVSQQLEKAHLLLISVLTLCKDENTVEMVNDYFEQGDK